MTTMTFEKKALAQQGYSFSNEELSNITNGLRFTPLVCMGLAIYGLTLQNANFHFALAALGILPFWAPRYHPFDLFYNYAFRFLVKGAKLPPNPLQRRIACVMGGLMNIGIGIGFLMGNTIMSYVFAGILIPLQIVVISTHFCVASWMYEGLVKLLGFEGPIEVTKAKDLVKNGALLVDVRSSQEFNQGHIEGALNIPLDVIEQDERVKNNELVLYCKSGVRCKDAQDRIKKIGNEKTYVLGAMKRWD